MRPIQLAAHTRPITSVVFNRDGDLLFTAAKDNQPMLWFANNGERVGTYVGHKGAVMDLAVDFDSKHLLTCSGDGTVIMWAVETGEIKCKFEIPSFVPGRAIEFDIKNEFFALGTGRSNIIYVYKVPTPDELAEYANDEEKTNFEPICALCGHKKEVNALRWGPKNQRIYSISNDGTIAVWNFRQTLEEGKPFVNKGQTFENCCSGTPEKVVDVCAGIPINSMSFSADQTMLIMGCDNSKAVLYDTEALEKKKEYVTDKPVKDARVHPELNIVMLGGGQHARDVTTTKHGKGKFEAEFYHLAQESKFGVVKTGHFSPINTVAFSPDGKSFVTGAEEGTVRIFRFSDDFASKFKRLESSFSSMQ